MGPSALDHVNIIVTLLVLILLLLIWLLGRGGLRGQDALLVEVASRVLQDAVVIAILGAWTRASTRTARP